MWVKVGWNTWYYFNPQLFKEKYMPTSEKEKEKKEEEKEEDDIDTEDEDEDDEESYPDDEDSDEDSSEESQRKLHMPAKSGNVEYGL